MGGGKGLSSSHVQSRSITEEVRWELEVGADTEAMPYRSAVYWLVPHGLFSLRSLRRCSADLPTGQSAEDLFSKFCPLT